MVWKYYQTGCLNLKMTQKRIVVFPKASLTGILTKFIKLALQAVNSQDVDKVTVHSRF